jgi:hypothetical protein
MKSHLPSPHTLMFSCRHRTHQTRVRAARGPRSAQMGRWRGHLPRALASVMALLAVAISDPLEKVRATVIRLSCPLLM